MNIVEQGETFDFTLDAGDDDSGLTCEINVLQYPGDTPTITRTITQVGGEWPITLTSAETAALAVGQWYIHSNISDASEDIREPIKLYISEGWI